MRCAERGPVADTEVGTVGKGLGGLSLRYVTAGLSLGDSSSPLARCLPFFFPLWVTAPDAYPSVLTAPPVDPDASGTGWADSESCADPLALPPVVGAGGATRLCGFPEAALDFFAVTVDPSASSAERFRDEFRVMSAESTKAGDEEFRVR